jgi:hypothetical protein
MSDSANREVRLQLHDAKRLFASADKIFYFLGGIFFSEMLFAFTGSRIEINYLGVAFASVIVIGTAWVICRAVIRMRKLEA